MRHLPTTLHERLVLSRKLRKMKQQDVADAMGVHVRTISNWERAEMLRRIVVDALSR